jgi:hypothetical protein
VTTNARVVRFSRLRLPRFFLLALALLAVPIARADTLDTVLDAMHKAGVIEQPVVDAKPLIECLAKGSSVADCAGGSAANSELANDPQVQNVLDIFQSVNDHDWYAVLKKAGITVGCGLIPGGQIKDVACGELGKIAAQVLDGVGSVLGAVGGFVTSIFGGGSDPAPISEEDYYRLNFMPWYHWSVVHQLDNDTPANVQTLNAPMAACVDYYDNHTYSLAAAQQACNNLRTRLGNTGYIIGNAFRQETESYFQLHFAPKVDEWAQMSMGEGNDNINIYAKQAMNTCVADERAHLPLPNPGFDECQAMKQSLASLPSGLVNFQQLADQAYAQCQALANQRSVPANDNAYTRICQPITNRIIGKVILAMGGLKSAMETAAAAGCPNSGTPKSILCSSDASYAACVKAIPEHASLCMHVNNMPAIDHAKQIFDQVSTAANPCLLQGSVVACLHPTQRVHCNDLRQAVENGGASPAEMEFYCELQDDPAYDALKQTALAMVDAMNAEYDSSPSPSPACQLARFDPLVVTCPDGFNWDASQQRVSAVYNLVNANNSGRPRPITCLTDDDQDGSELPCLEAQVSTGQPPALTPVRPIRPVQPLRVRPAPVIKSNDG